LPSYREGFPNVLLQAGAMKIPSIVSDVNGSNEIIIDGLNGFILKKNSTEELLQVMTRAIFDKELCFSLGDNARCRVEKLFTNEIVWNALRMEYDYLLMSKGIIEMVK
jgi:glycosyltransferase involved in cell wall biosynthesis